ncbi:MAG TPA: hypothetical protein VGI34_10575 [Candidatus Acidoferrales bacterium]|jgi:chromosome segregation ATPase
MRCKIFAVLLLLFAGTAAGQSRPADSEGLDGIRAEIHQLRQDLRTLVGTTQRAQILLARVQVQDAAVKRAQDRIDGNKSKLAQIQEEEGQIAYEAKHNEDLLRQADNENSKHRKELEETVARFKAALEHSATEEQETQGRIAEAEEQLRIEQAKLGRLQDELDRLDKALEQSK